MVFFVIPTLLNHGVIFIRCLIICVFIDSAEPKSVFKDRFWKIYAALEIIEKGLKHGDYDFVYEQLDKFITDNIAKLVLKEAGWEIPFKKACYHILCKNVKACERHLSEIIKRAGKNLDLTEYLKQNHNTLAEEKK